VVGREITTTGIPNTGRKFRLRREVTKMSSRSINQDNTEVDVEVANTVIKDTHVEVVEDTLTSVLTIITRTLVTAINSNNPVREKLTMTLKIPHPRRTAVDQ
jgi:hypothetical protein